MPAAVAVPLIMGAASVGGQVVSAKMQSNAAKNAAKTQSNAANQAMVNTRADTDRAVSYIDAARAGMRGPSRGGAYGMLSRSLGIPGAGGAVGMGAAPVQKSMPTGGIGNAAAAGFSGLFGRGGAAPPQYVQMRSPDGEVAAIHPDRVPFYEQKGAVRL